MKKQLVMYHANCTDGFAAAWAAWKKFGDEAEYIPCVHNEPPPDVTDRDVLIVDFSYKRDVLLEMKEKAASIRVLDHHVTAQEDLAGLDFCLFDMERSGAGITWDDLHPGKARPELISYVEDRDLWRWKLPHSKEVNAFISSYEYGFRQWDELSSWLDGWDYRPSVIVTGSSLLRSKEIYVKQMVKQVYIGELDGHDVPFVNASYLSISEVLHKVLDDYPDAPFAVGYFFRGDGKYQYSLRSRGEFDVSELAKKMGGGGHKKAAGFSITPEQLLLLKASDAFKKMFDKG